VSEDSPRPARVSSRFPLRLDRVAPAPGPAPQRLLRPQRPVHEAAADATRPPAPAGLGLDSAAVRARMVERIRAEGVRCEPVLAALGQVARHRFVDSALANQAYEDTSLPIGLGQTISKPSVVARMLALLVERAPARAPGQAALGRVLEIGTGCGYQAALLSLLSVRVVSVERLAPLYDRARSNLSGLAANNLRLVYGDGRLGHAPNAPYDCILAAAGGDELPAAWLEQLAVGGRLVAPMHSPSDGGQMLLVVDRSPDGFRRSSHDAVHFVPLKSGVD
jgi:protein-L-isoaspartate(D-aspartate) O-methyltransferase